MKKALFLLLALSLALGTSSVFAASFASDVAFEVDSISNPDDWPIDIQYRLNMTGDEVEIEIFNASTLDVVRSTTTTAYAGLKTYSWNGRDNSGVAVPSGDYKAKITVTTNNAATGYGYVWHQLPDTKIQSGGAEYGETWAGMAINKNKDSAHYGHIYWVRSLNNGTPLDTSLPLVYEFDSTIGLTSPAAWTAGQGSSINSFCVIDDMPTTWSESSGHNAPYYISIDEDSYVYLINFKNADPDLPIPAGLSSTANREVWRFDADGANPTMVFDGYHQQSWVANADEPYFRDVRFTGKGTEKKMYVSGVRAGSIGLTSVHVFQDTNGNGNFNDEDELSSFTLAAADDPWSWVFSQMEVDADGNVYVFAKGSLNDGYVGKYAPNGTRLWIATLTDLGSSDQSQISLFEGVDPVDTSDDLLIIDGSAGSGMGITYINAATGAVTFNTQNWSKFNTFDPVGNIYTPSGTAYIKLQKTSGVPLVNDTTSPGAISITGTGVVPVELSTFSIQ